MNTFVGQMPGPALCMRAFQNPALTSSSLYRFTNAIQAHACARIQLPHVRHASVGGVAAPLQRQNILVPRFSVTAAPRRLMSTVQNNEEKFIYISKFEPTAKSMAMGSLAQLGVCTLMAGLVTFHPAAASSAALPGWTMGGRAMLGSGVVGFGASVVFGLKGFVEKHVLRISVSPSDPGMLLVYTAGFPMGQECRKVPKDDFYAITAAYEAFDLEKESQGKAPIVPVYVGGKEPGTYIMDLRGDFLDRDACVEALSYKEPAAK